MLRITFTVKKKDDLIEDHIFLKETLSEAIQFIREYSSDKYKVIGKPLIEDIAA